MRETLNQEIPRVTQLEFHVNIVDTFHPVQLQLKNTNQKLHIMNKPQNHWYVINTYNIYKKKKKEQKLFTKNKKITQKKKKTNHILSQ